VIQTLPQTAEAKCIVCRRTSTNVVLRENGYEGRACQCGTVYTTPVPQKGAVDPEFVGHPDEFYDLSARFKARWVRLRTRGSGLLEVGCGSGKFLAEAQALGFHVEGIEVNRARAKDAAERIGGSVQIALFESCEPGRQRFDVVYHCDMLAHFEDPKWELLHMKRFLNPEGVIAFEVGIIGGLRPFWYRWMQYPGYPQHRWFYSKQSLAMLLEQAGYEVIYETFFDLTVSAFFGAVVHCAARATRRLLKSGRSACVSGAGPARLSGRSTFKLFEWIEDFLRYRVGAYLPTIGPATALIIARPFSQESIL
jgi:SAM-dependent methyltransferase